MDNMFRCPKCGCDHTTKVPVELLDGVKGTWLLLVFCSLFGIALSPFFILVCIGCITVGIILNIVKKIRYRNYWIMQCQRCGNEFSIINPDKADVVSNKKSVAESRKNENTERKREIAREKVECISRNGMLETGEQLIAEIPYFGFHKNAFANSNGKLKITNKSYICYNDKGSFRIARNAVIQVKKKNYFGFIPTGIQIRATDKRGKYNFVVIPNERDKILSQMKTRFPDKSAN